MRLAAEVAYSFIGPVPGKIKTPTHWLQLR